MIMQKKAALYVRVSTTEQAEEGYSVGSQTEKLKAYCTAMGYSIYNIYTDPGFTGANLNRPAMQTLMQDVQNRLIDIVIVMKLDRLSRSQKDTLYLIEDVFLANNCEFTSVTESFDTSTPYGRAFIGILAVFAQFERERIKERVQDGKIERAKEGKIMNWAKPPVGYDYVNEAYVVNVYEAAMVRRMFDLCEEGLSMNKIKAVIDTEFPLGFKDTTKDGKVHLGTIKRILRNRTYLGIVKYAQKEYPGLHEPIITQEQFDKVQVILELNRQNSIGSRKNPFRSTHLLTGMLFCANCGARMHAQSHKRLNNDRWYYICYSVSGTSKKYRTSTDCHQEVFDGETLDNYVLNVIANLKAEYENQSTKTTPAPLDMELVLQKRLDNVNQKMNKLLDLYLEDRYSKDELERKNKVLIKERDEIESELAKLKETRETVMTKADAMEELNRFENVFGIGSLEDQKRFLAIFIDHIEIDNGEVNIVLNRLSD